MEYFERLKVKLGNDDPDLKRAILDNDMLFFVNNIYVESLLQILKEDLGIVIRIKDKPMVLYKKSDTLIIDEVPYLYKDVVFNSVINVKYLLEYGGLQ